MGNRGRRNFLTLYIQNIKPEGQTRHLSEVYITQRINHLN